MVDFRLINYMDMQILCEKVYKNDGDIAEGYAKYTIFDLRDIRNIKIDKFILNISKYYKFYDTNEVVLPLT